MYTSLGYIMGLYPQIGRQGVGGISGVDAKNIGPFCHFCLVSREVAETNHTRDLIIIPEIIIPLGVPSLVTTDLNGPVIRVQ